jgi:hypothetical protein
MKKQLFEALVKIAGASQEFLDSHFGSPQWKTFQKNLRSKDFVQAVKEDPRSDSKLKRFSENIARHKQAKGVPSFQVPSQVSGKHYTVKYHPEADRYSCNCGDWTYAKSWKKGQKTRDCKHVRMVQLELKAQGSLPQLKKEAFARLAGLVMG